MTALQGKKRKKLRLSMAGRRAVNGYLFILPWLIGFICFYVASIAMTLRFSVSDLSLSPTGGYLTTSVGLTHYIEAFTSHASFTQTLVSSVGEMIIDVPLIIFFSLFMAILLNRKFKGRGLVRAIFFLPIIFASDAITDAMSRSLTLMNGGLSTVSSEVSSAASGGLSVAYYISLFENLAMPASVLEYLVSAIDRISSIITASGVQIIIFIAALQAIPSSLYEVSRIEGATAYETFWKVTFPMIMPHIITNLVYTIITRFAESDLVALAYSTTFTDLNYGLGAVFSVVATVVVGLILILTVVPISKRTFYYN